MPDEDINTEDIPELDDESWKNARVRYPAEGKERLTIRFDDVVVVWKLDRLTTACSASSGAAGQGSDT